MTARRANTRRRDLSDADQSEITHLAATATTVDQLVDIVAAAGPTPAEHLATVRIAQSRLRQMFTEDPDLRAELVRQHRRKEAARRSSPPDRRRQAERALTTQFVLLTEGTNP